MDTTGAASPEMILCPTCSTRVMPDFLIPAGDSKVCPNCREEYLQRLKEGASDYDGEYEAIRKEHIKHEASLKSIGILYWLGGIVMLFGMITTLIVVLDSDGGRSGAAMFVPLLFNVLLGALFISVGQGYRKLKRWVRIPGTIFSVLGLLGFPFGTLINGYILYLMWSQKGTTCFSAEYQDVIAATPDVKYRTSPAAWAVLGLLIVGIIGVIVYLATTA